MTNSRKGHDVVSASNLAPGDTITDTVTIGNAGTTAFVLSLRTTTTSLDALAGELHLTITKLGSPATVIESGGLSGAANDIETLRPGKSTVFAVSISLPATAGNNVQDQSATVDLTWSGGE
jgi:hypothetical protein